MPILSVPYHLDDRLEGLLTGMPISRELTAQLPPAGAWERMAVLYELVARAVTEQQGLPLVISGDCTTSLGILAGLQRSGRDPGIVWFDAHADFHTETTTTSGYLGGLPLALAAGIGTLTLPAALGLRPVAEARIVLVDARDTDPGEEALLARSAVHRVQAQDVDDNALPDGDLYLHVDVDVSDPRHVPDLLYPVPHGPDIDQVLAAVHAVAATGRLAAVGIAATWRPDSDAGAAHRSLLHQIQQAVSI